MDIETKNANLDTMAVTIQALHVNGKQMTLAVFRQLPAATAYNSDGTLNKDIQHWGLVRYQIKDEGDLWLVGSDESRLFRCAVNHNHGTVRRAKQVVATWESNLKEIIQYEQELTSWEYYQKLKKDAEAICPVPSAYQRYEERVAWITGRIGPQPPSPNRPKWVFHSSDPVPDRSESEAQLRDAQKSLLASMNAETSQKKLLELLQLFIAV